MAYDDYEEPRQWRGESDENFRKRVARERQEFTTYIWAKKEIVGMLFAYLDNHQPDKDSHDDLMSFGVDEILWVQYMDETVPDEKVWLVAQMPGGLLVRDFTIKGEGDNAEWVKDKTRRLIPYHRVKLVYSRTD